MMTSNPNTYAFRLRFHVEPAHRFESDVSELVVPDSAVRLSAPIGETFAQSRVLKLTEVGFRTEAEAQEQGRRWHDAVLIAGLRMRKGFDLGRYKLSGGLTAAGVAHFSQHFGAEVRNDVHGLDVYEDRGQKFVEVTAEAATASRIEVFLDALKEARGSNPLADKLRLACELYGLSRFANEPRVHLLTLITAVEAVADPAPSGPLVDWLVGLWLQALPPPLATDESFLGRLRELKRESISRACARTVGTVLGDERAREFKKLYGTRSTLVHKGFVAGTDLVEETAAAEEIVSELLLKTIAGGG
jgi:hypothetical protein